MASEVNVGRQGRWPRAVGIAVVAVGSAIAALQWAAWYFPPPDFWGSQVAPRVTWDRYEDDYRAAVAELQGQGFGSEYALNLPEKYRFLTADGFVATRSDGSVFFPLWLGMPDDAGGYWYSPNGSPQGGDMYGMGCLRPVNLSDDWWSCGLAD